MHQGSVEVVADRPALRGGGRGCRPPGDACGRPRRRSPDPRHRSRAGRSGCGRAVPARRQVRVRHRQEHGQQGLVHGAEGGRAGEIYYPTSARPRPGRCSSSSPTRHGHAVRASDAAQVRTTLTDPHSLSYRQTFTERTGAWRLTATYVTDPARATVLVDVSFRALRGRHHRALRGLRPVPVQHPRHDSGRTTGRALVATDDGAASAFVGSPGLHRDVQRVPRHQRRLDRPARRRPHGLAVHLGRRRQRRADRGDRTHRAARAPARDARARLRRRRRGARSPPRARRCGRGFGHVARAYAARVARLPARC